VRQVTFETQARSHGAWRTVAIHDDRPAAVAEAERILAGKRTPAVRVVQVVYDPETASCSEYTVFRATCLDQENERARRHHPDQGMFAWGEDGRRRGSDSEGAGAGPAAGYGKRAMPWIERHWPSWAPDWATTALALSFAVLLASVMFRWSR
jgi:hypothetical protein